MKDKKPVVGIVLAHFDLRNDIRKTMSILSRKYRVVLYTTATDEEAVRRLLPEGVEFRSTDERDTRWQAKLTRKAYRVLREIPASKDNFYLMERFKAGKLSPARRARALRVLKLHELLPNVMSYDTYLDNLEPKCRTRIDDLDHLYFLTNIADDELLARAIRQDIPVSVYVASWDHPCKHTSYSKRVDYCVWNEGIGKDLVELQGIDPRRIRVIGSGQLAYVDEYLKIRSKPEYVTTKVNSGRPFVYFACSIALLELVEDELTIIKKVAEIMLKALPDHTLLVRPYPILADWGTYKEIEMLPNVVIDQDHRRTDMSLPDEAIYRKYDTVDQATAFLHLGTTMGLEAVFLDTPSLLLDFGYTPSQTTINLYPFIHQYQLEKYLIAQASQNVIRDEESLAATLRECDRGTFVSANKEIAKQFPLVSFEVFAEALVSNFEKTTA